jgi:ornithine cyclodeaminase/alanine dehydrogenase-like protein (mu-crystallin family)
MTLPTDTTSSSATGLEDGELDGIRLLDGEDVDALATSELGLEAARASASIVARGGLSVGRVQVTSPEALTRVLIGLVPELDLLGFKQFHKVGKHVYYHVHLFRLSTGKALAIIDGRRITGLRTSSCAAAAFSHVFGEEPTSLAVIGSGEEATEGLRALSGAIRLDSVRVFSRSAANREALAEKMAGELEAEVLPVGSVADALGGADAAYVATTSAQPVLDREQVEGVRLIGAVGSSQPDFCELAPEIVSTAPVVVVDCADTPREAGELVAAAAGGWDPSEAVLLGDFLQSEPPSGDGMPLLFDSVGSVEQDLVLADRLLRAANAENRGRVIAPIASLRTMR